jgi:Nuclease-related domain
MQTDVSPQANEVRVMAQIYGSPGKKPGERLVYETLQALPPECIIYSEPKLTFRYEIRYPDFVIVYHLWGVVVLEVKDWLEIEGRDRTHAWLRGSPDPELSPVEQARGAAPVLVKMLEQDDNLRGYAVASEVGILHDKKYVLNRLLLKDHPQPVGRNSS